MSPGWPHHGQCPYRWDAVPLGLRMVGKTKVVIAGSIDSPWQNKWCTRTRCSVRRKRRLGQRQAWGQSYGVDSKGPSRRHSLRRIPLHHTSCSDWNPSPELKWRSWAQGQRVSVGVPGEAAQGHYGLTQSGGKKKKNYHVIEWFWLFTKKNVELTWVHNCNGLGAKMHLSHYTQLEKTSTRLNFFQSKRKSGFIFFLTLKSISLNYLSGYRKR